VIIEISLYGATTKHDVLTRFGETLELGGPDGNVPVDPTQGRGWGFNWDALADSLTELGSGGIWGTSRKFTFPLKLTITGSDGFRTRNADEFEQLKSVLEDTRDHYSRRQRQFDFNFA